MIKMDVLVNLLGECGKSLSAFKNSPLTNNSSRCSHVLNNVAIFEIAGIILLQLYIFVDVDSSDKFVILLFIRRTFYRITTCAKTASAARVIHRLLLAVFTAKFTKFNVVYNSISTLRKSHFCNAN